MGYSTNAICLAKFLHLFVFSPITRMDFFLRAQKMASISDGITNTILICQLNGKIIIFPSPISECSSIGTHTQTRRKKKVSSSRRMFAYTRTQKKTQSILIETIKCRLQYVIVLNQFRIFIVFLLCSE